MGLLITQTQPTRGMIEAADHAGTYIWPPNGQHFKKIQMITVSQLLAGDRPTMPPSLNPYIEAQKATISDDQMTLGM
jgi:hypothetical protein